MKTTKKILIFLTVAFAILFIVASLATGNCNDLSPEPFIKFTNLLAGVCGLIVLILSFVSTLIWVNLGIKEGSRDFIFYLFLFVLWPFVLTELLIVSLNLLISLGDLYKCYHEAYYEIGWDFGLVIDSPIWWLTLGLVEIVMVSCVVFKKKSIKASN